MVGASSDGPDLSTELLEFPRKETHRNYMGGESPALGDEVSLIPMEMEL